jgi:hypothetical protein
MYTHIYIYIYIYAYIHMVTDMISYRCVFLSSISVCVVAHSLGFTLEQEVQSHDGNRWIYIIYNI